MYKRRYLESQIIKLSRTFPVLLITGARQVGKTTLLRHINANFRPRHNYVTLDEFDLRFLAKNDPGLFLQQYPPPLIIDEIQYAPQLFGYVKAEVDRRQKMGSYWLTGSQQFHLMKNVSESLAGRIGIVQLLGISQAEENGEPWTSKPFSYKRVNSTGAPRPLTILRIFAKIVRGFFPRLLHSNAPTLDAFYGSYVQTYIDRDIRDLMRVSSLSNFERFVRVCAARTASVLNLSDLARDSDVSVNTVKEWLSLLEASGQIFFLRPYYKNLTRRLIKAPKLYFLDTGLVCYLTGWRNPRVACRGAFAGALFETFVVSEIIKSYRHRGMEPRIFYFRTKEKIEVDLLIEEDGELMPVEIKLSSSPRAGELKGIAWLKKTGFPVGNALVVAPVGHPYPLDKDLMVIPPCVIS